MKESKKNILKVLSNDGKKKTGKFDRMVLLLALQKIDGDQFEYDDEAVYTADRRCLVYSLSQKDSITVPEGVEVIGEMAFRRKKNLKNVILPTGLQTISRDAFFDCDRLDAVYIPATVREVEGYAFAECESLKTVIFAGKPKHISRHAFEDSDSLSRIVVPAGMAEAFNKALHYDSVEDEYLIVEAQAKKTEKPEGEPKSKPNEGAKGEPKPNTKPNEGAKGEPKPKPNEGAKGETKSNEDAKGKRKANAQDKQ